MRKFEQWATKQQRPRQQQEPVLENTQLLQTVQNLKKQLRETKKCSVKIPHQ